MLKRSIRLALVACCVVAIPMTGVAQMKRKTPTAPEKFSINAGMKGPDTGAASANFVVNVQRYNTEKERAALAETLRTGGYPGFLPAVRKSPIVGHLEVGSQVYNIRYAYQTVTDKGRSIVVVVDKPVYFAGGGRPDAKPREGYELAVAQFEVDDIGLGKGTMAGAARVKPGGPAGVQIDDYGDKPIELTTVRRLPS